MKLKIRTAAVVLNKDRVLLYRNEKNSYWSLPGGKVEVGESTDQALVRELLEEVDLRGEVGPLKWVIENFYRSKYKAVHEIGFYYEFRPLGDIESQKILQGVEGKSKLIFQWFTKTEIHSLDLHPAELRTLLFGDSRGTQHLVLQRPQ